MISLPFTTPDIDGGLSEGKGVLTLDGDEVTVRLEVAFMGLFSRATETVRFEVTDLDEVRHARRFWGDRLTLRTRPPSIASGLPGCGQGEIVLKTKRRHRRDLDALLDRLDLWLV